VGTPDYLSPDEVFSKKWAQRKEGNQKFLQKSSEEDGEKEKAYAENRQESQKAMVCLSCVIKKTQCSFAASKAENSWTRSENARPDQGVRRSPVFGGGACIGP